MIILLIIAIFSVLFYILFLQTKEKETFDNHNDVSINYTLNNEIDGPVAYLRNIRTFSNGFYEQASHENPDSDDCRNDAECGINGVCLERNEIYRCNKIINKEAFRFIEENRSHIVIPNVNPERIVMSFIILTDNVMRTQPVLTTSNNAFELFIEDSKFLVKTYSDNEVKKYYADFTLKNNKLYEIILRSDNNTLNISLDRRILTIPILKKRCTNDNDCIDNGICLRTSRGNNYCTYNRIEIYFGMKNEGNTQTYFGGYIGEILFNVDKASKNVERCNFDASEFKNQRICKQECNRIEQCTQANCDSLCQFTPKCEFVASGRHTEDCIQLCIANNDCDANHCNEQCRNCGQSCPWNSLDETERYDSDYYDKFGRPSPPRISIMNISADGTKVSLRWKPPYQGNSPINGYTMFLYKTFDKSEGVKVSNISTMNCGEYCNYILTDIDSTQTYTLGIKGYNSFGLGKMSNLLTFKPDKKTISKDFSIVPNVDESTIGEFNYCNVEEE